VAILIQVGCPSCHLATMSKHGRMTVFLTGQHAVTTLCGCSGALWCCVGCLLSSFKGAWDLWLRECSWLGDTMLSWCVRNTVVWQEFIQARCPFLSPLWVYQYCCCCDCRLFNNGILSYKSTISILLSYKRCGLELILVVSVSRQVTVINPAVGCHYFPP